VSESFLNLVIDVFNSYDNLNYKLQPSHGYSTFGRIENEKEAQEVDKMIEESLKNNKFNYEILKINKDNGVQLFIDSKQFKEVLKNVD